MDLAQILKISTTGGMRGKSTRLVSLTTSSHCFSVYEVLLRGDDWLKSHLLETCGDEQISQIECGESQAMFQDSRAF